jgi:hypothetical protein
MSLVLHSVSPQTILVYLHLHCYPSIPIIQRVPCSSYGHLWSYDTGFSQGHCSDQGSSHLRYLSVGLPFSENFFPRGTRNRRGKFYVSRQKTLGIPFRTIPSKRKKLGIQFWTIQEKRRFKIFFHSVENLPR